MCYDTSSWVFYEIIKSILIVLNDYNSAKSNKIITIQRKETSKLQAKHTDKRGVTILTALLAGDWVNHCQNPLWLAILKCLWDKTCRIYILMFTVCQIFLLEFNIIKLEFCQINHHFNIIRELTLNITQTFMIFIFMADCKIF